MIYIYEITQIQSIKAVQMLIILIKLKIYINMEMKIHFMQMQVFLKQKIFKFLK